MLKYKYERKMQAELCFCSLDGKQGKFQFEFFILR